MECPPLLVAWQLVATDADERPAQRRYSPGQGGCGERVSPITARRAPNVLRAMDRRGYTSAAVVKEIIPDVQSWSVFSDRKGYAFNGYAVSTDGGTVLIDPPDPGEDGWPTVDLFEPFAGVWLTNRSHSRAAAVFRERYGLTVWAHEADADRLEAGADRVVAGNMTIAGEIEIVPCRGNRPARSRFTCHGAAR
jgi:hypothetical protein